MPPKPSSWATNIRLVSKFTPASAPAPSGQVVGGGEAEVEALEVAAELPEVGEQVVREVHRLGALQVGVAGKRPVEVALGELDERAHQPEQQLLGGQAVRPHEHRHVGGHLVVARARGVELPAHRPGDLGQAPLDRHVHVLVAGSHLEAVLVDLLAHLGQAALERGQVLLRDDPAARQHARVRERLLEVVGRQPVVEARSTS